MSVAHGDYAGAIQPMKRPRKRGKVRECAVGRNTAFAFVRRNGKRPDKHLRIGTKALTVLRRVKATFVETIDGAPYSRWLDVWRVPVAGHTPQELTRWLRQVGIDGPHYGGATGGKHPSAHAVGREMRQRPAAPGELGFTERHLPQAARRKNIAAALQRLIRAKGDFPSLLAELDVSRFDVLAQPIVALKYVPKSWAYTLSAWMDLAERQPDFPRLFSLMATRSDTSRAAYDVARKRDRNVPDYWPTRRAAMGAFRLASQQDQLFRNWIESQPGVTERPAKDKFVPTTDELRAIADGTDETERAAILSRLFDASDTERAALADESPNRVKERERAARSVARKRQRRAALSEFALQRRNERLAKRPEKEERAAAMAVVGAQRQRECAVNVRVAPKDDLPDCPADSSARPALPIHQAPTYAALDRTVGVMRSDHATDKARRRRAKQLRRRK